MSGAVARPERGCLSAPALGDFFGPPLQAMPACPGKTSLKVWSG